MDSRIHVLPEELVNRIAAGEVVERPASVAKELIENSLDARATDVQIEATSGGTVLIRVTDDGVGMSPEDSLRCLERHATSKLDPGSDLVWITTLGFRGEALPSIASVSRLRLLTRERGAATGTEVRVEAGRVTRTVESASATGTSIEVEDLFFNTPARRKFLRREATEAAYLAEAVQKLALSRPDVGFRLILDGREALNAPPAASLSDRLAAGLGRETGRKLHRVDGLSGELAVHGYVSQPDSTRSTAADVRLFVNSRPIRDRSLIHAIVRAYGTLLDRGRYPIAVLFLEMPPDQVDVNVHPTKAEVRFRDPRGAADAVHRAVSDTIRAAPWIPNAGAAHGPVAAAIGYVEAGAAEPAVCERPKEFLPAPRSPGSRLERPDQEPAQPLLGGIASGPARGIFGLLRVVGFLRATYILCESERGLVLLDQHAAHERVLFEELKTRYSGSGVSSQGLLLPQTIELSVEGTSFILAHAMELERLGFAVEPFGPQSILLRTAPVVLRDGDAATALGDVVGEIRAWGRAERVEDATRGVLARIACHAAFRSGDVISLVDAEAILDRLAATDYWSHCPHGRPLATELPLAEIEKRVGRR